MERLQAEAILDTSRVLCAEARVLCAVAQTMRSDAELLRAERVGARVKGYGIAQILESELPPDEFATVLPLLHRA